MGHATTGTGALAAAKLAKDPTSTKPYSTPISTGSQPIQAKNVALNRQRLEDPGTCIQELNQRYAVVVIGGNTLIIDEHDPHQKALSFKSFQLLYNNIYVRISNTTLPPLGKYWCSHAQRRQYTDGIVFDPANRQSANTYNLWKGFALAPSPTASCNLILDHIRTVICDGDQACYDYFVQWLALLVQRPHVVPGVAIVMLSEEGAGKGILMQYLGAIFGRHYKTLTHRNHLISRFTGHLDNAVLVYADELEWHADKDAEGALKGMITEPERLMERKYADPVMIQNCISLIISSNEQWVVPASMTDRRYFVLDVSNAQRGNTAYFQALGKELQSDGAAGLLHYLLQVDVSQFHPSQFPKTAARVRQQIHSLPPLEKWLHDALCDGELPYSSVGWPVDVTKEDLYASVKEWWRTTGQRRVVPPKHEITALITAYGGIAKRLQNQEGGRPRGFVLPDIHTMRDAFAAKLNTEIDWPGLT